MFYLMMFLMLQDFPNTSAVAHIAVRKHCPEVRAMLQILFKVLRPNLGVTYFTALAVSAMLTVTPTVCDGLMNS